MPVIRNTLLSLLSASATAAFAFTAAADPAWPMLFREAALPALPEQAPSVSYKVELVDLDDTEAGSLEYSISAPAEQTPIVTIHSFPSDTDEDDKQEFEEELNAEADGDIWCDDHNENVGGPITLVSENDTEAVYSFPANPKNADDKQERKMLERSIVTVTIDKSTKEVSHFSYELTEPFKPVIVAKINTFKMEGTCASHPAGRPVISTVKITVAGKAMGKTFSQTQVQTYSDIQIN